jgi:hypothetical protein
MPRKTPDVKAENSSQPPGNRHAQADAPKGLAEIARRRALRFAAIAAGVPAAAVIAFGAAARFEFFGAGFHVNVALALGVAGAILLGVGLMALSFYSDRSGADDAVLGMKEDVWTNEEGQRRVD